MVALLNDARPARPANLDDARVNDMGEAFLDSDGMDFISSLDDADHAAFDVLCRRWEQFKGEKMRRIR